MKSNLYAVCKRPHGNDLRNYRLTLSILLILHNYKTNKRTL